MAASASTVIFITYHDKEITIILLMMYLVIAILGVAALVLNAVVLDTLVKRTALEATDLLMCHLAVTDMLTGVLVLHTVAYSLLNFQNMTECLLRLGTVFIFVNCSMYHLTLLTVDRFIKIVFPYRYQDIITRLSVSIMSSAVWVFSINLGLLPLYGWRNKPKPSEPPCALLGILTTGYLQFGLFLIWTPSLVMTALYFKIFFIARRHSRAITALNVAKRMDTSSTMKFTKMVVLLVGTYFVSFTPMAMVVLVYTVGGFQGMSAADVGDYIVYTSVLTFANSVVNPIIYAFKVPPVRRRFLRFIGKSETSSQTRSTTGHGQNVLPEVD